MGRQSRRSAIFSLVFLLVAIFLLGVAASSSPEASPPLPADETELLCHTDNPSDCYPKIFQATNEFQVVRDDQDLPSGLHIRLNVWTGKKEAKFNDPTEQDPALEGLPVDHAIVLVDPEAAASEGAPLPSGAPQYDPVGRVKKPNDEAQEFHDALAVLRKGASKWGIFSWGKSKGSSALDDSLEGLEEFAHDMYYGTKIAEDEKTLRTLFCLMSTEDVFQLDSNEAAVSRAQRAGRILAATVQNNGAALSLLDAAWPSLSKAQCSSQGNSVQMRKLVFGPFLGPEAWNKLPRSAALAKARVSAINGLLKSDRVRQSFLSRHGMKHVFDLLLMVSDPRFWPCADESGESHHGQLSRREHGGDARSVADRATRISMPPRGEEVADEHCWDYHVDQLAEQHKADDSHWSMRLSAMLKQQRRTGQGGVLVEDGRRDEL